MKLCCEPWDFFSPPEHAIYLPVRLPNLKEINLNNFFNFLFHGWDIAVLIHEVSMQLMILQEPNKHESSVWNEENKQRQSPVKKVLADKLIQYPVSHKRKKLCSVELFLRFKNIFNFFFKLIYFFIFSDNFDALMSKIIFKK
jgi:hypothetical protein